ncbi:MAG: pyrimidine dimer DNA glycosylase/endonuclease V [Deltaproteobacteria bacterium]
MRLWTLHPKYLDAKGLVALWREALLAQAVLRNRTRGYARHPQIARFRESRTPVRCIAEYLKTVLAEGARRGYRFDARKIARGGRADPLIATAGQLDFEWSHLLDKVKRRDPEWFVRIEAIRRVEPHPLFHIVPGAIEDWEKTAGSGPEGKVR